MLKIFLSRVQQGFQQIFIVISVVSKQHCHVFVIASATDENPFNAALGEGL
jgi:hypothetical protein